MLTIHIDNSGVDSLEVLLVNIITTLLKKANKESVSSKFKKVIRENVIYTDEYNSDFKVKSDSRIILGIKDTFAFVLQDILNEIRYKGLLITIDNISDLSSSDEFPNWYKNFVDYVSVNDELKLSVAFILTGYTTDFGKLHLSNPSFSRIFHREDLKELNDNEVESFYKSVFDELSIKLDTDALRYMVKYTEGLPFIMQEIGNQAFYKAKLTGRITKNLALKSIIDAGMNIGNLYVKSNYETLENSREYLNILKQISKYRDFTFNEKELEHILKVNEKRVLNQFLTHSLNLNIIEYSGEDADEYFVVNKIFRLYFKILGLKQEYAVV